MEPFSDVFCSCLLPAFEAGSGERCSLMLLSDAADLSLAIDGVASGMYGEWCLADRRQQGITLLCRKAVWMLRGEESQTGQRGRLSSLNSEFHEHEVTQA